jgi:stress-induced morphogen
MAIEELIKQKLIKAFDPEYIEVINDSKRHLNHAGSPGTQASHFYIKMAASVFKGKSRLESHRLVYTVLDEELKSSIHALQLDLQ